MSVTLLVFHFDISGKYIKEEQSSNKCDIFVILHVLYFRISPKFNKELHL